MERSVGHTDTLAVAIVSTYPPRACGIATFSRDLAAALRAAGVRTRVVGMNEEAAGYTYEPEVAWQIHDNAPEEYRAVADALNHSDVDVVNLQHEFGIFGGEWGEYVLELVERLDRPLVTTLHTVLPNPPARARRIVRALSRRSSCVVVMSPSALSLMEERYGVARNRLRVIWHGVPEIEWVPRERAKERLGLGGRQVLSTFGLVNAGKGIEDVLDALPSVATAFPDVLYLILGETHPNVRRREGESYRNMLLDRVRTLGLGGHVRFENRYMADSELIAYLQVTDIYLTPYHNPDQIVSGTLSWALAAGCAIVSTPYRYAQDVLADDRGVLVPFRSPSAIASAVRNLLASAERRQSMGQRAYRFARQMLWPSVGSRYAALFEEVAGRRAVEMAG
ncbi:MAG: glycosyltransferase family 4 protein [Armatimonadota bacterium]|nr:glycosyltransferase family 4 protein [Armatimonadota bacterium]